MPRKKKRRTRSPHPGVVVVRREEPGRPARWRAKYRDPDTRRVVFLTLNSPALGLTTPETRLAWAKAKSAELAKRRAEIASGVPRRTSTSLADVGEVPGAVSVYLAAGRFREETKRAYGQALGVFLRWAASRGVSTVESLTPALLAQYRASVIGERVRKPSAGGGRGATAETSQHRSAAYCNRLLRELRTFLGEQRREGRTPLLSRDDVGDSLRRVPESAPLPHPLSRQDLRALLLAAIAHDAATFKLTRAEHQGQVRHQRTATNAAVHRTLRYQPIAPLVAFELLAGTRIREAQTLEWSAVDLEASGDDGKAAGEIRLLSGATKTRKERVIDLGISPGLRALLGRLRLRAERRRFVFGGVAPLQRPTIEAARRRLVGEEFEAPAFDWQNLRVTCASYLVNAPGIYGAAAVFLASRRLGHSTAVADRHYRGVVKGIPATATTLEEAMGIADLLPKIAPATTASEEPAAATG